MRLIPLDLQKLINEGLDKVNQHPQHDLLLGHREAIYSFMGPYRFEEGNDDEGGYKRRVKLAVVAVSKVAPIWEEVWPQNSTVDDTLAAAEDLMSKSSDEAYRSRVQIEVERLWDYTTQLTDETREIAGIVGMAAVRTLSLALWDGYMSDEFIDINRLDSQDFMVNDMHFYAATVFAGGPPYPIALAPRSSTTKRKSFWEWWLNEAVPNAWQSVE